MPDSMPHPIRLVTAEELERMPEDDCRYELVDGRLIHMSPVGALHGVVTARLLVLLAQHAKAHDLGFVATEVGFKLASHPDTVRAPDVAFVRQERARANGIPRGFWQGPPDLAVEVLSPDDRASDIAAKVGEYLASGVCEVWVVNPDAQTVTIQHRLGSPVTFTVNDAVDSTVLAGFSCQVRNIFE